VLVLSGELTLGCTGQRNHPEVILGTFAVTYEQRGNFIKVRIAELNSEPTDLPVELLCPTCSLLNYRATGNMVKYSVGKGMLEKLQPYLAELPPVIDLSVVT
jgi:hypothetical protein